MAFKREETGRHFELTGLIDIVFLLLIFFLVSFVFSLSGDASESKNYSDIELPKTNTALPVIKDDWLQDLMFQIVSDTSDKKTVYALWPSYSDSARMTRSQAFSNALTDSSFASFPDNFLDLTEDDLADLPVSRLIASTIDKYVEDERLFRRNEHPIVEVRAVQTTEFRILRYIMDQCSSHKDAIPQIVIRMIPQS